jgi:LacI family transcriptional regulator
MREPSFRRPNIETVASRAKVAKSTVSRVLNGGYASEPVRARVARAIRELGYAPSTAAINFSLGKAGAFGFVVEDTLGEWVPSILSGIEEELRQKRITLLINSLALNGVYDASIVKRWIRERRVDGIVFVRPRKAERALVEAARKAGIGLCAISPDVDISAGKIITSDNREAGRDVGRHLAALGHRQIGFVGGPRDSRDTEERLHGLEDGLAESGLGLVKGNVHFAARYHVDEGRRFADRWLALPRPRATAVVFGNDAMAIGFMSALQQREVRVPETVSVVGFDDLPAASWVWPRLTTARQKTREMGLLACQSLIRQSEAPDYEDLAAVALGMNLVVRESTAPPARSRRARR